MKHTHIQLTCLMLLGAILSFSTAFAQEKKKQIHLKYKKEVNGQVVELDTVITGDATLNIDAIMKELGIDPDAEGLKTKKRIRIQSDGSADGKAQEFDLDLDVDSLEGLDDETRAKVKEALKEAKIRLHQMDGEGKHVIIKKGDGDETEDVFIFKGDKQDMGLTTYGDNIEVAKGANGEKVIKWVDDKGVTHEKILPGGEGKMMFIKKSDGDGENVFEWEGLEGDSIHVFIDTDGGNVEKEVIVDENGHRKVIITSSSMSDEDKARLKEVMDKRHNGEMHEEVDVKVHVDKDGKKESYVIRINAFIREVEEADIATLRKSGMNTDNSLQVEGLNFYPNPTDGRFILRFDTPETGDVDIRIVDMNGRPVYQEELMDFTGTYEKKIDISGNASGIYFLNLGQNDKYLNKKIVLE